MKNLLLTLTLAALTSATLSAASPGTDIISISTLSDAGITLPEESNYDTNEYVSPVTGISYQLTGLADKGEGIMEFGMGLSLKNTEATELYLKEIRVTDMSGSFSVYCGNELISSSPFMQEGISNFNIDIASGILKADAPYHYMGIWPYLGEASSIEIEWSDEAPLATAGRPYIVVNSDLGCPSGTTVTIDSDTTEALIEVRMTRNNEVILESVLENPATVTLSGEIDDVILIEARAVVDQEGWMPSEWISRKVKITPIYLMEPEFSISSYSSIVVLGQSVTISNPNINGTMTYSVGGEDPVTTTDSTVTVTVDGQIGDSWSISAYCEADGCETSEIAEWNGTIDTNVCPAPTFSPGEGEQPFGTEIHISATYPAQSVTYRINGGEWTTSTSLWDLSVTLEEDMTIEAYSSAESPYVDSEIVSASFSIEQLGELCDVIDCATFGLSGYDEEKIYTSDKSANGASYSFKGQCAMNAMNINSSRYIATVASDKKITRIKVDALYNCGLLLYVSDEIIDQPDASMTPITIVEGEYASGEWITMSETSTAKYFYLTTVDGYMSNNISRVVVEYSSGSVGIITIDDSASDVDTVYHDLTGRRVVSPGKGIYLKTSNGKTSKVIVM